MNDSEIVKYVKELDATAFLLDCKPFEVYEKVKTLMNSVDEKTRPPVKKPPAPKPG